MSGDPHPFLQKLQEATNDHDLAGLVDCFSRDYRNGTPAHPSRGFQGEERVRANWAQIFSFVPDVKARVVRWSVNGPEVWSEWEMSGTRLDGSRHLMRGVIIFTVEDGKAAAARFYLEPVDETSATTVQDEVRHQVHADTSR